MSEELKGALPQRSLYQVFQALDTGKKTGILHLERDQSIKALYFEDGRIRFATTTRADDHHAPLRFPRHVPPHRRGHVFDPRSR